MGERSDWVKNLRKEPEVGLRIGSQSFSGQARVATPGDEDLLARRLIAAKYEDWHESESLPNWTQTATPVVIKIREGD